MRARWIAAVTALGLVAGCSLDLDRLRAGAGIDGGAADDAGALDAAVLDADAPDAAPLDGGNGCHCEGGSFQPVRFLVGGTGVSEVSLADLEGDGDLDLVVSRRGAPAALLRMAVEGCGQTDLVLAEPPETLSDTVPDTIVALADWNDDRVLDVIAPVPTTSISRALLGNVSSVRYAVTSMAEFTTIDARAAFAFDLDGLGGADDVAVLSAGAAAIFVLASDRASPVPLALASMGLDAAFAAPTATGAFGAIARGPDGIDLVRFTTTEDPPFAIVRTIVAMKGSRYVGVHFADVNGDGRDDLIAVDTGGGNLEIHLATGDGVFDEPSVHPISPLAVASGRVLSADALGLVTVDRDSVDAHEYRGRVLSTPQSFGIGEPAAIAVGDVDGDGTEDLVIGHTVTGMGHITVYRRVCL